MAEPNGACKILCDMVDMIRSVSINKIILALKRMRMIRFQEFHEWFITLHVYYLISLYEPFPVAGNANRPA
jgi:hypothetical protein